MVWVTILYVSTGIVAFSSNILVSYGTTKGGGITGIGNLVFIYPAFACNILWGFTFPFLLYSFLDSVQAPMIRWSISLGGGIIHTIISAYSVFAFKEIGNIVLKLKSQKLQ